MIIITATCADHLYKTKVMARSAKHSMPEAKVVTCLIETKMSPLDPDDITNRSIPRTPEAWLSDLRMSNAAKDFQYFDEVVLAKNLGIVNFNKLIFKYNPLEACCIMKYYTMLYAMNKYKDEDKFVYLDSDMKVFGPFDELMEGLEKHSVVLTPHRVDPDPWEHFLKDGTFNGGCFAVKRTADGMSFIHWMTSRLNNYCYIDEERGLFVDQKWLNLAPVYFDVHILRHPGYNLAGWNLHESERKLLNNIGGIYRVKDKPLRLIHFSGINIFFENVINAWFPDKKHPLFHLRDEYVNEWEEMGRSSLIDLPWSYNFFHSGEGIIMETRLRFKDNPGLLDKFADPFAMSNGAFL
jgi:hypothetical protein